ncbi:MAG: histidine--tRNA ligase [Thermodesulfovibrionaceae bacterium]
MRFNTLRGMRDILPQEVHLWQYIEEKVRKIFEIYNFKEIRPPILEAAELFLRSIGEDTDIVEKEMYIFHDKKGRTVALRPEATASVVRAYIEHRLFNNPPPQRFYYIGPMFRYERPQKGRFRQFHQAGVEVFGIAEPLIEAELLYMVKRLFEDMNIRDLTYEINSIGCLNCRAEFKQLLLDYLENKVLKLCSDCQRRFQRNPLRVLDCKVESCKNSLSDAPLILDFLCDECEAHFEEFKTLLKEFDIDFIINPKIVRGLDYYTKTVFEITTPSLGAQSAVVAGGRYDNLVESFGGPKTPAVGFAIGMERLIEIFKDFSFIKPKYPTVYVAYATEELRKDAINLARFFRDSEISAEAVYENTSLKSQLRKADRFNAYWVIIVGPEEMKRSSYRWKNMRNGLEGEATLEEIVKLIKK